MIDRLLFDWMFKSIFHLGIFDVFFEVGSIVLFWFFIDTYFWFIPFCFLGFFLFVVYKNLWVVLYTDADA